jgi:hypothetical protein
MRKFFLGGVTDGAFWAFERLAMDHHALVLMIPVRCGGVTYIALIFYLLLPLMWAVSRASAGGVRSYSKRLVV